MAGQARQGTKKPARKGARRPRISAENNAKLRLPTRRKPRGKPFEPGNAHRFPSGQSGNPGGRPKLLSDAYRERLAEVNPDDPHGRTWAEIIAAGMSIEAAKGGAPAAREIRQATEGNKLEVSGPGGTPIRFIEVVTPTSDGTKDEAPGPGGDHG